MAKKYLLLTFLFVITLEANSQKDWKLIYANTEQGVRTHGNITELIQTVREGEEIRLGWGGRRVEHVANASFLTILTDSVVFAQIEPIYGQTPEFTDYTITLKENLEWVLMGGTNGKSDAMMRNMVTGEIVGHNSRNRAFKWFVRE